MSADISDAGRAMCHLSQQLDAAEAAVGNRFRDVLLAQDRLREAIINRDAIERAMILTGKFIGKEA